MTVYVSLLVWVSFLWAVTQCGRIYVCSGKGKCHFRTNLFLATAFFSAFLLMGARGDTVGKDTAVYKGYFSGVSQLKWNTFFTGGWDQQFCTTEKGFMVFEKILSYFTQNGQWLIILCSVIYMCCIYCFVRQFNIHPLTAFVSFLCVGSYLPSMNVMRQSVAVGLCCMAWIHLQKKQIRRTVLWILAACTFHRSSVIFFAPVLLKKIPANRKTILLAAIAAAAFSIGGSRIVYWVIKFIPVYAGRYGRGRWDITSANGILILWFIIALVIAELAFTTDWRNNENHIIFEVMLCGMAYLGINILGQSFDGLDRLSIFFQPFLILLFEYGGKCFEQKISRMYYMGVAVSMMMLFLRLSSTEQYQYIPFW